MWTDLRSDNGKWRGKLPQLLDAQITKARATGRTPFVEVGATWCGPCRELEHNLHTPPIIDAFAGAYVIHLDVNEWDLDVDLTPVGITGGVMPFIVALDTTGHATAELRGKIDAPSIKTFVRAHLWHSADTTRHQADTSVSRQAVSVLYPLSARFCSDMNHGSFLLFS
jgi:thiol-disulfide isomerase/thioredoxin